MSPAGLSWWFVSEPWDDCVPLNYRPGMTVRGRVAELHTFGVLIQLEPNITALVHMSEIRDPPITHPSQVLAVGDELLVRILNVDREKRIIGGSMKRARAVREPNQ